MPQNQHADARDLRRARRNGPQPQKPESADRLPPHSPESEQALLGCCLMSPNDVLPACLEHLEPSGAQFYDLRHQRLFNVMAEMYESNEPIDEVTLFERLNGLNELPEVGGAPYLSQLPDAVPSAANYEYYLGIIQEKARLRGLIQVCTETVGSIYECEGNANAAIDEAETRILRAAEARHHNGTVNIHELSLTAMRNFQRRTEADRVLSGLGSGLGMLDQITDGFQPQQMIVLAARPSQGKTSLAMNIAEFLAVNNNFPVGVFSLEMSAVQLTERMVASRAQVNSRDIRPGRADNGQVELLLNASHEIGAAPLYIDDTGGISILQLRAKARRMWQRYGIRLFVVDYLQLIHSTNNKVQNRQQEVGDVSHGIKALAKELDVPILALCQLNRNIEYNKTREPTLADLRESGDIEADADLVGFLHRPWEPNETPVNDYQAESIPINLIFGKNRNGPTGIVRLTFLKTYTRFAMRAAVGEEEQAQADAQAAQQQNPTPEPEQPEFQNANPDP